MWQPVDEARARDAFGGIWRMDRRPWHLEQPALAAPTLQGYTYPPIEAFLHPENSPGYLYGDKRGLSHEQILAKREECQDSFLIAGAGWGMWDTAWQMRGFENALTDSVADLDFFEELLDRNTEMYLALAEYAASLPVDTVTFGENWGTQTGVMLGPERWCRLLKPCWARVYEAIHRRGKLVITHSCGSIAEIIPDLIEFGLDVLESVQPEARGMVPYERKRRFGDRLAFWGGLGSQSTIPFSTPEAICQEVRHLCEEMGRGGGYILAPAKSLQPITSTENAVALVEAFSNQG